jgi:hypothetical protein
MSWLASLVVGLLSAAAGAASSLAVADYATRWHHVSDREGGRGYAVVALGLLGLVGGLVIGLVASRFFGRQGGIGFARGAGAALAITLTLVAAAGALSYATAEHAPEIDGETLELEIEETGPLSERAFAALTADSALSEWLPHASYLAPPEQRPQALRTIAARPQLATELAALIRSADLEVSNLALRLVGDLPEVPATVAEPVREVGQGILDALERFNVSKPEDDPGYEGAAAIGVRFSAWFQAVKALHARGGVDQRVQLASVLKLASVRPDSRVMKDDIARIAGFYTEKWGAPPPSRE